MADLKWYVARVRPQREDRAVEELLDLGFRAFHPTYSRRVGKGRTRRDETRPIIPGYAFVQFDVRQRGWERCYAAKSIFGLLGSDYRPMPVPEAAIVRYIDLVTSEDDIDRVLAPERVIDRGDTVRISTPSGNHPFEGWIVPVMAVDKSGNLAVEFQLFGGKSFATVIPRSFVVKSVAA